MDLIKNKWVRFVFLVATIGFAVFYLVRQLDSLQVLIKGQTIFIPLLLLSTIFIFLAVISGILIWHWVLRGFGFELPWVRSARIQLLSIMAKYIPGLVWQFSGKVYLAHEAGVPGSIAVSAMGMEVGVSIISGIAIALSLSAKLRLSDLELTSQFLEALQLVGIVLIVLVCLTPFISKRIFHKQLSDNQSIPKPGSWVLATIMIFLGWGLISTAFYYLAAAFSFKGLDFTTALFIICVSYVGGILVIFVPNGLVVREAVMMALLPTSFDPAAGLLLSLVARIQVIICELFVTGAFFLGLIIITRYQKSKADK